MPPYSADVRLRLRVEEEILRIQRDRLRSLAWDTHCQNKIYSDNEFFGMRAMTPDGIFFSKSIKISARLLKILQHPFTSIQTINIALQDAEAIKLRNRPDYPEELTPDQMAAITAALGNP